MDVFHPPELGHGKPTFSITESLYDLQSWTQQSNFVNFHHSESKAKSKIMIICACSYNIKRGHTGTLEKLYDPKNFDPEKILPQKYKYNYLHQYC